MAAAVNAWRTIVLTRHRLTGSQPVGLSRSQAISEANPADLPITLPEC